MSEAGEVVTLPPPTPRRCFEMGAATARFFAQTPWRVAIIGDAAFVARPHVAAGVSKAADDATALVTALDTDDIAAGLRKYEAARLPENRKIIERARHLGAYLQATQTAEERARSARHSIPEAVLAETAVLDFLYA